MSDYKLYHGDCLEVMQRLIDEGVTVDAVICDPPYGTTACKWDSVIPFPEMWQCINGLIKKNGAVVLFGSEPFSSALRMSNIKNYKYDWVWDKLRPCGSMLAKKRPLKYHEIISIFYQKEGTYNPQMSAGKMMDKAAGGKSDNYGDIPIVRYKSNEYYPRSIQEFAACHNMTGKVHPTQKPIPLMEYLIKTYTNEGDTILDFTCGSGSTICAALNANRKSIGIERDPHYFQVAKNRIENHPIQRKLF